MATASVEMQSFSARLRTFEVPQQLRRQQPGAPVKKKGASTARWPHEKPEPALLARAGFYYRPDPESLDNVACFLCDVRLDGWEETDNPIQEHLNHTRGCPWATAISVGETPDRPTQETRDPLAEEMIAARKATFATGEGWPHEGKKGWKCKIKKMVDAGWCWDPSAEEGEGSDGVSCFYCGLSLDGWEPKDDPFDEHKRREPACPFFELLERHHGVEVANGKPKKGRATGKGGRGSTASKASRISTMSSMSAVSDVISLPGSYVEPLEDIDDSNVTTATSASQATVTGNTKSKKKVGKPKATAKGTKAKKKDSMVEESVPQDDIPYPDMGQSLSEDIDAELSAISTNTARKGGVASKNIDSSVIEISQTEMVVPVKATKDRNKQAQKEPELKLPHLPAAEWSNDLQNDIEHITENFEPVDESTPVVSRAATTHGVKRTSDGQAKYGVASTAVEIDGEVEPPAKRKRGRPKKASNDASIDLQASQEISKGLDKDELEPEDKQQVPAKKGKAKGKAKGKKASTARSSRSSKASVAASVDAPEEPEDLLRDEMVIEQELARIAAEQAAHEALQMEQEKADEFEPSPSSGRISKDNAELQKLQDEVEAEPTQVDSPELSKRQSPAPINMTPSPNGSDKENVPSSFVEPSPKQDNAPSGVVSSKTIRVPLAASTPNRSPTKMMLSPSKKISHLASSAPWSAVDLDVVLVSSLQAGSGEGEHDISELLSDAAQTLKSPEKKMTVEEWVRYRAEKSEEELKRRCEGMVSTFEQQSMKALASVRGIQVAV